MQLKPFFLLLIFVLLMQFTSAQNKSNYYFTNPTTDYKLEKKVFNGIRFSSVFTDDLTANGWSEFKVGWYRKSNKLFGLYPLLSSGYFYDNIYSDLPYDNNISSGIFIESGISTAFHFAFINIRLNNSVKKYFDLTKSRGYHHSSIYNVSIEAGFFYHRYDLTAEIGIGCDIFDDMNFYGASTGLNFGILLGNIKYSD